MRVYPSKDRADNAAEGTARAFAEPIGAPRNSELARDKPGPGSRVAEFNWSSIQLVEA